MSRGWDGAAGSFCAASAGVPARCGGQWARLGAWAPLAACGGFAVFLPHKISELEMHRRREEPHRIALPLAISAHDGRHPPRGRPASAAMPGRAGTKAACVVLLLAPKVAALSGGPQVAVRPRVSTKPAPAVDAGARDAAADIAAAAATHTATPLLAREHAVQLRDRGYTIVRTDVCPELIASARVECSSELGRLLDGVSTLGLDPIEQKYLFSEVTTRHRLRWDFRPEGSSSFDALVRQSTYAAAPIIHALHHELPPNPMDGWLPAVTHKTRFLAPAAPSVQMTGAIISRPGAKAQRFHADAPDTHFRLARLNPRHRLFNAFIPLVDIEEGGDGTMLWPASHLEQTRYDSYLRAIRRSGHLEDDEEAMNAMVAPGMRAGDILIFDYRLIHRGMPNVSRERCMAYAVLATGGAWDAANFPPCSLWNGVDGLPDDPQEREIVREEARGCFKFWSELRERETDEVPAARATA